MNLRPVGEESARLAARVGAPLAAARQRTGLSAAELARRCGVSAQTIRALERGQTRPRRATLQKLADALVYDSADAFAFAERLAEAAGPSLAADVSVAFGVAREQVVQVLMLSLAELGVDPEDERVRTVVVRNIRRVVGGDEEQPAIGAGR